LLLWWKGMVGMVFHAKELLTFSDGLDMFAFFFAHRCIILCNTSELIKQVFRDTKTFQNYFVPVTLAGREFFGGSNVAQVNGEDWKRQREIMNPGFVS